MPILTTIGAAAAKAYGFGAGGAFRVTISSNQTDLNLRTYLVTSGWNEISQPVVTIDTGIYISSSSTATPALTISGSFPAGVYLINSGFIVGKGGDGGGGGTAFFSGSPGSPGGAGGLALSVSVSNTTIDNAAGTIGGGGGGAGGGGAQAANVFASSQGWGGGGGGGGRSGVSSSSGGGGGGTGASASRFAQSGNPGTTSGGGTGGLGAAAPDPSFCGGTGGTGGTWGSAGSSGGNGASPGQPSFERTSPGAGGAAGAAITGNSNITWIAFGIRLGSIS